MSKITPNNKLEMYSEYDGDFRAECQYTNETGIKYVVHKLRKENKVLEGCFAFVTPQVENCKDLETLVSRFNKSDFPPVQKVFIENSLKDSFISIQKMYEHIKVFIDDNTRLGEEVCIHVDMTGGLRHSTMLMMGLIRLLKYHDLKIGYVIYTNWEEKKVENAKALLNLYSIVGGAEEFVNYGNVYQLSDYFCNANCKTKELNKLLPELIHFSEVLKGCANRDTLIEALNKLCKAIKAYESSDIMADDEVLFKTLLPSIKKSYTVLFDNIFSDELTIQVIEWCLDRNLLQQAVTFYTEWIPEYIFSKNYITEVSDALRMKCDEQAKKNYQDWKIFLFRYYVPKKKKGRKELPNILSNNINLSIEKINSSRWGIFYTQIVDREIILSVDQNLFLELISIYEGVVNKWRNKMNHASNSLANTENNKLLIIYIKRSLDILKEFNTYRLND